MVSRSLRILLFLFALAGVPAHAADLLVDADGTAGAFTNIAQAMAMAVPGDRILVMPGSYPAFQFSRGVSILGLGSQPGDVRIGSVDFHISLPIQGFDALLSNLTIGDSSQAGLLAISGNEGPPGALVVDGVILEGGVFLAGGTAQGFHVMLSNTLVAPAPGQGFGNAAVHVGGGNNTVEIVNSRITGWDADPASLTPAGIGLRLVGGTTARVVGSRITGGNGNSAAALGAGATAIDSDTFPAPVSLRLDGAGLVQGGAGAAGHPGGHGVDISGTIEVGDAEVYGGPGSPDGLAWADAQPVPLPQGLHLLADPLLQDAQGATFLVSGGHLGLSIDAPGALAGICFSTSLDMPSPSLFVTISDPFLMVILGSSFYAQIPTIGPADITGLMLYAQGFVRDPSTQALQTTNTVAARLDLSAANGSLP